MKLSLLPLENDDLIRLQCEGPVTHCEPEDPLQKLLGPHCYSHKVLLDLAGSQFLDTSGVSWLLFSHKRFLQAGGKLVVYAVPPAVTDVLRFMGLTAVLHLAPDQSAACALALAPAAGSTR
jgi:anti-anti-sigma factor